MPPAKRRKKGLEPNLYETNGYYRYRHPITKKVKGMGKDKKIANFAARQLNCQFMKTDELIQQFYIDKVDGKLDTTIGKVIERYETEYLPNKDIKESTRDAEKGRLKRLNQDLGTELLYNFSVRNCADYLDQNFEKNPYVKYRNTLVNLFDFAKRKGLFDKENPANATESKSKQATKKTRQRMSLEQFKELHKAAPEWLQNAMEFSLITLQGLNEVVTAKFEDIDEDRNTIKIIRKKTDQNEWAFLELTISPALQKVIDKARGSGIKSPFIIHHKPSRKRADESKEHWTQILPNYLGKQIRALREDLSSFNQLNKGEMPTFHEVRSLGSHLYSREGYDNEDYVQPLMAHADIAMTKKYQSGHEIKWTKVEAELDLADILSD